MTTTLHIATYNIHKGFSQFAKRMVLHELRDRLRELHADVVFLQEVLGAHEMHSERYDDWPDKSQYEFLADSIWRDFAYGKNAVYPNGHHGNALLSKFPIVSWENEDISAHAFEQRGLLHCEVEVAGLSEKLHCVCVHLGLFSRGRKKQLAAVRERIERVVPPNAPLIIAGDFNDWYCEAGECFAAPMGLTEAFENTLGKPARSFPSKFPVFRLDRIYVRGFAVKSVEVLYGRPWSKISDHAPLSVCLTALS